MVTAGDKETGALGANAKAAYQASKEQTKSNVH